MSLTLRRQKGSPLTFGEMDGNLTYLQDIALAQPDVLASLLEDEFGWSDITSSYGSEKVEGIKKFSTGEFFDALDAEDPETFKAPVLIAELDWNWIIVSGSRFSATVEGGSLTILNGLIFPQGGDLSGGGSFISFGDEFSYVEILNATGVKSGYRYQFDGDSEEHLHIFELSAGYIGAGITVIEVVVPDAAATWGDVTVTVEGLS